MIGQASEDVLMLVIGSLCNEIAATVMKNGRTVLSNVISSQIATHTVYGGVVPEIASREHIKTVNYVIERALAGAQATLQDITVIGVAYGPGLIDTLLVGMAEIKAIAYAVGKPPIGVHHIEGRASVNLIESQDLEPPSVYLVVSGGRTHLVIVKDYGKSEIIGRTRDDTAGETPDKMARSVGLEYLGGPKIGKTTEEGNPHTIQFPRGRVEGAPYDFSFSGPKSAMLNRINYACVTGEEIHVPGLAASFQDSVMEFLISHAILTAYEFGYRKLVIAGGATSNSALRKAMTEACRKDGLQFYYPSPTSCTDNVVMIGAAAHCGYLKGNVSRWDLNVIPNLKLDER